MEHLHGWLEAPLALKKTALCPARQGANTCLLRHWHPLTTFCNGVGPSVNNIVEMALRRTVDHRKNAFGQEDRWPQTSARAGRGQWAEQAPATLLPKDGKACRIRRVRGLFRVDGVR
jgi:hypothetical protein